MAAVGTVRVSERCIWIEFDNLGPRYEDAYTLIFLDNEHVEYDAGNNEVSIYYPVRSNRGFGRVVDVRLARMARFRDGEKAWVAAPNPWSREDMSPDTLMLRTEPYSECPDVFWLSGSMTPVHPIDIHRQLDLPMVPHPLVYGAG